MARRLVSWQPHLIPHHIESRVPGTAKLRFIDAKVTVALEIEAEIPSDAPDNLVRTVTENSRTLKFTSQGFEQE